MSMARPRKSLPRMLALGLVGTAVFAGAMAYRLGRTGQPAEPSGRPTAQAPVGSDLSQALQQIAMLRGDLAQLAGEVAELRQSLDAVGERLVSVVDQTSALAAQTADYDGIQLTEGERFFDPELRDVEEIHEEEALHFAAIDTRLGGGDPDPGWSMGAAEAIDQAFQDPELAEVEALNVDCSNSICRFDAWTGEDSPELPMLLQSLMTDGNFATMAIHAAPQPGDANTVYLGRYEDALDES